MACVCLVLCVGCRNKEEVSVDKLGEATVVVFGSPRDKFSTTEVGHSTP